MSENKWTLVVRNVKYSNFSFMTQKVEQTTRFAAMVLKSEQSMPARVMVNQELQSCVFFVLRGGTDEQREQLQAQIEKAVICKQNLSHGRRQMIICRANDALTDAANIEQYQRILAIVLGVNNRTCVRFMRRMPL